MNESTAVVVQNAGEVAGFDGTTPVAMVSHEIGAVATVAREEGEIKAAILLARNFPRDEAAAFTKIVRSAERPSFAEGARYVFPRGGQNVEGPSIKLAREIKRCWGNMRSGVRVLSADQEWIHLRGWALDLETNAYVEAEDKFQKKIFRKNRGWVEPDERDLRELVNRRGAFLERNCILSILPPDIIDEAQRVAKDTLVRAAEGDIKQDRDAAIRRIAVAFAEFGVTTDVLSAYLHHPLAAITDRELADLRSIYTSIRDGQSRPDEHFNLGGKQASEGASELNAALKAQAPVPPPSTEPVGKPVASGASIKRLRELMGLVTGIQGEDAKAMGAAIIAKDAEHVLRWISELESQLVGQQAQP